MIYTDDQLRKIAGDKATFITPERAEELLTAPASQRARIYGIGLDQTEIIRFSSQYYFDAYPDMQAYWVSGTTAADIISKA